MTATFLAAPIQTENPHQSDDNFVSWLFDRSRFVSTRVYIYEHLCGRPFAESQQKPVLINSVQTILVDLIMNYDK